MAKGRERENPRFDPTRIVQPTSAPVDLYFRPMLRGPEPSKLMQVAEALGGISPTLNRLASDAAAAGIAAEKNAGTFQEAQAAEEALKTGDQSAYERKRTEAIEKAGGLAPWRFTEYLKATGERGVEKYRAALYENIDDISNPYNADGTLRPADYVAKRMQELYDQAGIPTDSYYITQGAMKARSEVDRSFYDRLMASRRQKVLQESENILEDRLTQAIEVSPDYEQVFGPGGEAKALLDEFYRNGGQNGDQILAKTAISLTRGYVSNGEFGRARELVNHLLSQKVGSRTIGNRHRPALQEMLEVIDDKEREAEFRGLQHRRAFQDDASMEVVDRILPQIQEMHSKSGFVSLTDSEIIELVKKNSIDTRSPKEVVDGIQGRLVSAVRDHIESINRPRQRDRREQNNILNMASQNARTMSSSEFFEYTTGLLRNDLLDFDQVQALRNINKQFTALSPVDRDQANDRIRSLQGIGWSRLSREQIAVDGLAWMAEEGNRAASDVMSAWISEINKPEFKTQYPDDPQRLIAQDKLLTELVEKRRNELLTQHRSEIERFNLTGSFDATVAPVYMKDADGFVTTVLKQVGLTPEGVEYDSLYSRSFQILLDDMRDEWGRVYSEPGRSPMTLEERKREFSKRVPDIKDRFFLRLRNNPDSLGLPSQLSNIIKANTRPPSAGTADAGAGKAATARPVSSGIGEFKEAGILARGPEYNAIFPSEAGLVATAKEVSNLAVQAAASPEKRGQHNEAKAKMGKLAEDVLQQINTTSVRDITFGNVPANLRRAAGPLPDVPLYEIRPDGVYVLSGLDGSRTMSALMTRRYWAAKALIGYTQDEVLNARTIEGVQIPKTNLDATEYLYFRSAEEFANAVDEFTKSAGKTGVIAERYLPLTGMTFEEFRSAQFNLIGFRKPLG